MAMVSISRSGLDRLLQANVDGFGNGSSSSHNTTLSRKEQLKQLSNTRVAGWTDTLAAKRKAKLDWKAAKARQKEDQRQIQDVKDVERRQRMRMDTLGNADRLLQEQTEKVRQFRSQQMLVETIDTRDTQLKEREEKNKQESAMEELWHMAVMENIHKSEQKSKKEMELEKKRSKDLAEDLKRQRDERETRIREHHHSKREEEVATIRQIAMDESAAEKAELQQKNERIIKAKAEMEKNQLLLKQRQEEARRKELEETRKCVEEVAQRNKISAARAELEIKHFEEKQGKICLTWLVASYLARATNEFEHILITLFSHTTYSAMKKMLSDRASQELKQRAMRECEIFERDVRLRHQKEQEKAEAKRKKLEKERITIDESRRKQLLCKQKDNEAERKLGDLYVKELARITAQQQDLERQKEQSNREKQIELRKMQQQQIREAEQRRANEKQKALEQETQVIYKLKKDDDIFKDFVAKEIENFKVQGKIKRIALLEKTLNS